MKEIDIDVEKYEKEMALIIVQDITRTYFGSTEDFLFFLRLLDKQQEKRGKNALSVIADMDVFFHFQNNKDALMNFESSLLSKVKRI